MRIHQYRVIHWLVDTDERMTIAHGKQIRYSTIYSLIITQGNHEYKVRKSTESTNKL